VSRAPCGRFVGGSGGPRPPPPPPPPHSKVLRTAILMREPVTIFLHMKD